MTSPSEPFAPADVTWTAVSPRLAAARLTSAAFVLVPLLIVLVVVAVAVGGPWLWLPVAVVLVVGVSIAVVTRRQVRAMGYAERADDLLIRRGIMFKQMVVVPYGRMQYIDVTAGPLSRKFGIASVQLHTAAAATSATIHGLPPQEAARLRERLASRGEARLAGL